MLPSTGHCEAFCWIFFQSNSFALSLFAQVFSWNSKVGCKSDNSANLSLFSLEKASRHVEHHHDVQQTDFRQTTAARDLDSRLRNDDASARDHSKAKTNVDSRSKRPGDFKEVVQSAPDQVNVRFSSAHIVYCIAVSEGTAQKQDVIRPRERRSLSSHFNKHNTESQTCVALKKASYCKLSKKCFFKSEKQLKTYNRVEKAKFQAVFSICVFIVGPSSVTVEPSSVTVGPSSVTVGWQSLRSWRAKSRLKV